MGTSETVSSKSPTALAVVRARRRPFAAIWPGLDALYGVALLVIGLVFVAPYIWMALSSFKTTGDLFKYSDPLTVNTFVPPHPTFANYYSIFATWGFGTNLMNSVIVSVGQVAGEVIVCSLAAFALSRMRFRGRDLLFGLIMVAALIPFEVNMIPMYIVVHQLQLQSSYFSIFLPWIANPLGIFLLRQSFVAIPRDYDDSARLDGAHLLQIFWYIILPQARPALVTLTLISFLWAWNAFLWPLIVMQDPSKQVIQVKIATFTLPGEFPAWGEIFAGSCVATIPVLMVFLALQRYYVRGFVMSGLKG